MQCVRFLHAIVCIVQCEIDRLSSGLRVIGQNGRRRRAAKSRHNWPGTNGRCQCYSISISVSSIRPSLRRTFPYLLLLLCILVFTTMTSALAEHDIDFEAQQLEVVSRPPGMGCTHHPCVRTANNS